MPPPTHCPDSPGRVLPVLIDLLRRYQMPELDHFFLAKLEVTQQTGLPSAPGMHWRSFPGGQRGAVIVHPFGENALTVVLLQPRPGGRGKTSTATGHSAPPGEPVFSLVFTEKQVAAFVEKTGDDNAGHRGENAVVPGLLLLSATEQLLAENGWFLRRFRVRFLEPVRVNQPIRVVELERNHWVGRHETGPTAFDLTISENAPSPG